jgi:hypothetical protein
MMILTPKQMGFAQIVALLISVPRVYRSKTNNYKTFSTFITSIFLLSRLGCGWCYDSNNPLIGTCQKGGFGGPRDVCTFQNSTRSWEYGTCPDVDECLLGLHNCHENATCSNKPGSFECNCNKVKIQIEVCKSS